jgi:hypothetical protein
MLSRTPCSMVWVASVLILSLICSTASVIAEQQNATYFRAQPVAAGCTNPNYPIDCGDRTQRWRGFDSGLHSR